MLRSVGTLAALGAAAAGGPSRGSRRDHTTGGPMHRDADVRFHAPLPEPTTSLEGARAGGGNGAEIKKSPTVVVIGERSAGPRRPAAIAPAGVAGMLEVPGQRAGSPGGIQLGGVSARGLRCWHAGQAGGHGRRDRSSGRGFATPGPESSPRPARSGEGSRRWPVSGSGRNQADWFRRIEGRDKGLRPLSS